VEERVREKGCVSLSDLWVGLSIHCVFGVFWWRA